MLACGSSSREIADQKKTPLIIPKSHAFSAIVESDWNCAAWETKVNEKTFANGCLLQHPNRQLPLPSDVAE
jgi:hypothetical protein